MFLAIVIRTETLRKSSTKTSIGHNEQCQVKDGTVYLVVTIMRLIGDKGIIFFDWAHIS